MNVVLGIVTASFLSQIYYALILDICPCHSMASFPFVLLDIYVCNSKGVSDCRKCDICMSVHHHTISNNSTNKMRQFHKFIT